MCGYIRRVTDSSAVRNLLTEIGLGHLAGAFAETGEPEMDYFYPAFGGDRSASSSLPAPMAL